MLTVCDYSVLGTTTRGFDLAAPVTLSLDDRRRHVHVIGKTGTGKTTLLRTLIYDDLTADRNFAVLDPLGGLAEAVIDAVPKERNDHCIYFNPADLAHPIGFNPLDRVSPDMRHLVADHVVSAFMHIWGASLEDTPRLVYVLYNSLRLLLDSPGSTLLGLPRLLVDERYRTRLLKRCADPVVRGYWENEFASYDDRFRAQVISPVQNKIGMLLAPPGLRLIIGQPRSTISIARLMNEGGILVANLAKGRIGSTASHLLGAFLATTIAQVAEGRATIPYDQRRDFTLYADEVQNFATESFAQTLSEARNWRLMCVLAHQYLSQLPRRLQDSVIANCGNYVVFRIGAQDASVMGAELDIENSRTLCDTSNFAAWAKLLEHGNPTQAFPMETALPEPPAHGRTAAVIAHTRARHTRGRIIVERMIARQLER
ncbi:MAG: type IV secretory system conjugative DNA transfer family protein [Hyphomicrobiaceae bacterium]